MTPAELIALGKARHGDVWIGPLSQDIGFHFTTVWRAATRDKPLSRDLANAVKLLPRRKPKRKHQGDAR